MEGDDITVTLAARRNSCVTCTACRMGRWADCQRCDVSGGLGEHRVLTTKAGARQPRGRRPGDTDGGCDSGSTTSVSNADYESDGESSRRQSWMPVVLPSKVQPGDYVAVVADEEPGFAVFQVSSAMQQLSADTPQTGYNGVPLKPGEQHLTGRHIPQLDISLTPKSLLDVLVYDADREGPVTLIPERLVLRVVRLYIPECVAGSQRSRYASQPAPVNVLVMGDTELESCLACLEATATTE